MSALSIITAVLLQDEDFVAIAGTNVRSFGAEQALAAPFTVLNIVSGNDASMLSGAGRYFDTRVSVECTSLSGSLTNRMGEAAIAALGDIVKQNVWSSGGSPSTLIAVDVDIEMAGSDITDTSDDRSTFRRVIDFAVRWRSPV